MKPDYKNSLVNLMGTIVKHLGGKPKYAPLKKFRLTKKKNTVLLVIDGLGYNYILKHGKDTQFQKYLRNSMTSLFPSTTSCCIPAFYNGLAPQQHAMTGWFVWLKEIGKVSCVLPAKSRLGKEKFREWGFDHRRIFDQKPIFEQIRCKSYVLLPRWLHGEEFNQIYAKKSKVIGYNTMAGFFSQIKKTVNKPGKKFLYAYWPYYDTTAHKNNVNSKTTKEHFLELDKHLKKLAEGLKDTNLIVTSDHGMCDCSKWIILNDHPQLMKTLSIPLCGEPRAAYCYVKPDKVKEFESYVKKKLGKYCDFVKSSKMIKDGWFGTGKPNTKLRDRVGDYVLIMKDGYSIKDWLWDEDKYKLKGVHGGVSEDEMLIPLILIESEKNK